MARRFRAADAVASFERKRAEAGALALASWRVLFLQLLAERWAYTRIAADTTCSAAERDEARLAVVIMVREKRRRLFARPALMIRCEICGAPPYAPCREIGETCDCATCIWAAEQLKRGNHWHAGGLRELAPVPEFSATTRR